MVRSHLFAATAIALGMAASGMARAEDAQGGSQSPAAAPAQSTVQTGAAAPRPDSGGLGEIVVTAQRRVEDLQKAALSIEAVGGEALRAAGIAKPDDLAKIAPGVQVGSSATTQVYIRGVGDGGLTATANQAVITSLDGVAIARPQAIGGNFFDLERVEVLRGPQGTLYGRNATGGAVNFLSVQPQLGEFSGYAEATLGNLDQHGIEGAINAPAGENVAFRLSFQLNRRNGYVIGGGDDDDHESVRLQAKFKADRLTVRTVLGYTHLGGEGTGTVKLDPIPGTSAYTGTTSPVYSAAYLAAVNAAFVESGGHSFPPQFIRDQAETSLFQNIKSYNALVQIDYELDFATLTLLPAYRRSDVKYNVQPGDLEYNVGGVFNAEGDGTRGETSDQYSLEARLGHVGDRLNWVGGVYGFIEDQSTDEITNLGPTQFVRFTQDFSTKAAAAFGQVTYSLNDRFRLTGGARYTVDRRSATDYQLSAISPSVILNPTNPAAPPLVACLPPAQLPGTLCSLINGTPGFYDTAKTFDRFTWKAGLEFDVAAQSMLYADVSTGFKAGGITQFIDPATQKLVNFAPELLTAYSIGSKNRFLDNKLQVNIEAFYWDYKDLQLTTTSIDGSGIVNLAVRNAGKARIMGTDLNILAKPWSGGTLHGAIEYNDTDYKEFLITGPAVFYANGRSGCPVSAPDSHGQVTVDCSGFPLLNAPKWSGKAGIEQVVNLANGGNVTFNGDVAFVSSRYVLPDFLPSELVPGYANLSASLTYNSQGNRWFVSGFARNITDKQLYTGGGGQQSPHLAGWTTACISPPRTYGARLGFRW
jgi:iron complex outermembrane receptor protein